MTQCVQAKNVAGLRKAVVENILKKLNAKLGGVNHYMTFPETYDDLDIMKCPVMIIGADVTHPQQGTKVWEN